MSKFEPAELRAWADEAESHMEHLEGEERRKCMGAVAALREAAASEGVPETVYKAVERILDENSAWVARPNDHVTWSIAFRAVAAAHKIIAEEASHTDTKAGAQELVAWADREGREQPILARTMKFLRQNVADDSYWSRFTIPLCRAAPSSVPAPAGDGAAWKGIAESYGEVLNAAVEHMKAETARADAVTALLGSRREAEPVALTWRDGAPPKPWSEEWFIAQTTYGGRVVLRSLPAEYTYDFKTADETYIKADKIKRWMQFPDSSYTAPPSPVPAGEVERLREAMADIAAERRRQIDVEGWTPEHDDKQGRGELAQAAAAYAFYGTNGECRAQPAAEDLFPTRWHPDWWKPKDRRRNLVRAGALVVAEIERLDRARST